MEKPQQSQQQQQQQSPMQAMTVIFDLVNGYCRSKALHTAVELNIPNLIDIDERIHYTKLAEKIGANPDALYRLLKALSSISIFHEQEEAELVAQTTFEHGVFSHTPTSLYLREKGVRDLVLNRGGFGQYRAWESLTNSIKTGQSTVKPSLGYEDYWAYLEDHPAEQLIFNNAMTGHTSKVAPHIAKTTDFSKFESVVDVGGSQGILILEILKNHPHLKQGINFDLASAIEKNKSIVRDTPLDSRYKEVGGSFFDQVPESDCYTLKSILHDWDDENSIKILNTIAKSIKPNGQVFIFEANYSRDKKNEMNTRTPWMDLHMLQVCNGKERCTEDWRALTEKTGQFKLVQVKESTDYNPSTFVLQKI